jgi:hypothetical protein
LGRTTFTLRKSHYGLIDIIDIETCVKDWDRLSTIQDNQGKTSVTRLPRKLDRQERAV